MFWGWTTLYRSVLFKSATKLRIFHRLQSTMTVDSVKHVYEDHQIVKSAEDKRLYRALVLSNEMKVMLISDPDTDKSSAAMDVCIGHMKDPWEIPGLAHFCEHMLFLGTEKYPEENEYSKFLNEHAGSSNAFTSVEHTNFYFDVAPANLAGTLDRFAQFFLCPLFTASATEREVNAVNAENDRNLQNDPWRLFQLDKALANPSHDFCKFGTGNKETLDSIPKSKGIDVRAELLKFHSEYYSSNIMGLAVLGRESLDELQQMVVPVFSKVENKNVTIPSWQEHPYGPAELQKRIFAVPVKDVRNLSVAWSIPDLQPYYASNPGHYLGHLVGHEGPGSLLSELKGKGWVNTLVGGQKAGAKGFGFFIVNVDLTEDGIEHVDDVITLMYKYINMLKKEDVQPWIFKECQDLGAMTFRFKDKEKPRNYTSSLAGSLQDYRLPEMLSAPYLMTEYRPDLVRMILDKLVPSNMRIMVVAKKFEGQTDQVEPWYGTYYRAEPIPRELLQQWENCGYHKNLRLPDRNEFIPTNFDIVPQEVEVSSSPEIIKDGDMSRVWFKQDNEFFLPKSCLSFEITSPFAYVDPVRANMTYLFVLLFKDALNEYAYAADLAGLSYNLDSTVYGIYLSVKGYSDKQLILLQKILEKFTAFKIDPKRFSILKELYERSLKNFVAEQPHNHAVYYTSLLMSEVFWTKEETLEALEEVTLERLQQFIPELLSKVFIECLIYGNITKQKALETADLVESVLRKQADSRPLMPSQRRRIREVQLPDGCCFIYKKVNVIHKSSCIEIYYQCGMQETRLNMLLELFCQVIGEPCFDILRTKEQLGYLVFSGLRRANGIQGLRIIVQSDKSPSYVELRVEAFLQKMGELLEELSEEDFNKHVSALATKRLERPKKMSIQNMQYWSEISSQQYNFDRDNIEVATLQTFSKSDLIAFYQDLIASSSPRRHKLAVYVISNADVATNNHGKQLSEETIETSGQIPDIMTPQEVGDPCDFKRGLALYQLPRPFIDLSKARSKL